MFKDLKKVTRNKIDKAFDNHHNNNNNNNILYNKKNDTVEKGQAPFSGKRVKKWEKIDLTTKMEVVEE